MKKTLKLKNTPHKIIGIDISHLQGTHMVASAVCCIDGMNKKNLYRKFNITTVNDHSNDPEAIAEAVNKRLKLCKKYNEPFPDLIIVDGGRAQLNYAYATLQNLKLHTQIDLISLAKKNEEIYLIGKTSPIRLSKKSDTLKLCQQIRDESHRFAVTFQRKKRSSEGLKSKLLSIKGLGKKRINALYKTFDTLENIKNAPPEDLCKINNLGIKLAYKIINTLNTAENT